MVVIGGEGEAAAIAMVPLASLESASIAKKGKKMKERKEKTGGDARGGVRRGARTRTRNEELHKMGRWKMDGKRGRERKRRRV